MVGLAPKWAGAKCTEIRSEKPRICPIWGQSDPLWSQTYHLIKAGQQYGCQKCIVCTGSGDVIHISANHRAACLHKAVVGSCYKCHWCVQPVIGEVMALGVGAE